MFVPDRDQREAESINRLGDDLIRISGFNESCHASQCGKPFNSSNNMWRNVELQRVHRKGAEQLEREHRGSMGSMESNPELYGSM